MTPRLTLSWADIASLMPQLAQQIPPGQYLHIVAIARGGLYPAFALSKLLDIPAVSSLPLSSYVGIGERGEMTQHQTPGFSFLPGEIDPETTLFVDDIVDSGATISAIRTHIPSAHLAALFTREVSQQLVNYSLGTREDWIQYPWDTDVGDC